MKYKKRIIAGTTAAVILGSSIYMLNNPKEEITGDLTPDEIQIEPKSFEEERNIVIDNISQSIAENPKTITKLIPDSMLEEIVSEFVQDKFGNGTKGVIYSSKSVAEKSNPLFNLNTYLDNRIEDPNNTLKTIGEYDIRVETAKKILHNPELLRENVENYSEVMETLFNKYSKSKEGRTYLNNIDNFLFNLETGITKSREPAYRAANSEYLTALDNALSDPSNSKYESLRTAEAKLSMFSNSDERKFAMRRYHEGNGEVTLRGIEEAIDITQEMINESLSKN